MLKSIGKADEAMTVTCAIPLEFRCKPHMLSNAIATTHGTRARSLKRKQSLEALSERKELKEVLDT